MIHVGSWQTHTRGGGPAGVRLPTGDTALLLLKKQRGKEIPLTYYLTIIITIIIIIRGRRLPSSSALVHDFLFCPFSSVSRFDYCQSFMTTFSCNTTLLLLSLWLGYYYSTRGEEQIKQFINMENSISFHTMMSWFPTRRVGGIITFKITLQSSQIGQL